MSVEVNMQLGGSGVCATESGILILVGAAKVDKQVMNIRVSGFLILFCFLEMDTGSVNWVYCAKWELSSQLW